MFDKLSCIEQRYSELGQLLGDMMSGTNYSQYKKVFDEYNEIRETAELFAEYKSVKNKSDEFESMLLETNDIELIGLIKKEISDLEQVQETILLGLKNLLVPKDQDEQKPAIIEIRSASGGKESELFAAMLFKMYAKYAERNKWGVEIIDSSESLVDGIKQISFVINSKDSYSKLKFESGVHRIQRVSPTDSAKRVHTSTATVAVLYEIEDAEVMIRKEDLEIDTFRAGGPGGQHQNKTDSAVRITHVPTNTVVVCRAERSQTMNKATAMKQLGMILSNKESEKNQIAKSLNRKEQVGSGDFSEKIRTYNFKDARCTDHRSKFTSHNLDGILSGDLDELIESLEFCGN